VENACSVSVAACESWGTGPVFLWFSVLILIGSNGKLESGIICVSFIAVFYAEFGVNGLILG
jgi:hypothetical protein